MAGRQAGAAITRYAGIQVQTSALGVNIPVGWGTFRCKCNLVDYLDFKSVAQKAQGGKGGAITTGYTYSATLILGVCEGPIDGISTVYVNGNVYTNGATTALAQAGLSLNTGAIGQGVWSYLTSNHPDHAIGYSGLAIVYAANYALDGSASTPQHSFEVVRLASFGVAGTQDADPSLVIADFFTNARYGVPSWGAGRLGSLTQYQSYCLAAGLLVSPAIDQQRSASDFLAEVLKATNSTCVWSEGLLKIIPYGDVALTGNGKTYTPNLTAAYSLTDDDFIPNSDGEPPVLVDVMDQSDAYNVVQLEYLDRANQYNMAIALASDAANVAQFGRRRKDPDTVHVICDAGVAARSAQLYLQRTLYVRAQYKCTVHWHFALLEPGDIIKLTDGGLGLSAYPVRIVQIDEAESRESTYDLICEDLLVGVANAPTFTMQNAVGTQVNTGVDPGGVEANLLLWSGDLTKSQWVKTSLGVSAGAANDPYGLPNASSVTAPAVNGSHFVSQSIAAFDGLAYTFSVCLQNASHHNFLIELGDGGSNFAYVGVDTNAGSVLIAPAASGAAVLLNAEMTPTLVAGIWNVTLTGLFPGVTTLHAEVFLLSDFGAQVWVGDGLVGGYVSQASLRQGLAAGAYAATTGAIAGPALFSAPSVLASGGAEVWAAAAGGPNWAGANVWISVDNANYQQVATINASCRYGVTTTALPYGGNLLRYSTDLTNPTWWGLGNATVTGGATDPLGGATAITWTRTASGDGFIYQPMQGNGSGKTFAFSVYLRLGTLAGNVLLKIQDSVIPVVYGTATVTPTGAWARYTVAATFPANAAAGITCVIEPANPGSAGETLLIAFPQLEYGSSPNSYVATGMDPASADPDTLYPLGVDLGASDGDLDTASQAIADASGTLCLVGSELIAYEAATLTNPNQLTLGTYIRRGVLNTPIASHPVGETFVRLDGTPVNVPFDATQAGKKLYVKFQSFNAWGQGLQDLAGCIAYTIVPVPGAAASPDPTAWSAVGTTLSNSGQSTPAIVVTGASDNPSATSIEFDYRVSGTSTWASAGSGNNATTRKEITSVQAGQAYDVSVLYLVNGIPSNREIVASGITVGTITASSGGAAPGAVLLNDSAPGAGKTFTCPAGSYGHVDIVLTGFPGAGNGTVAGGKGGASTDYGGGAGGTSVTLSFAVTPGSTAFTYTIPSAVGVDATCTTTGLSMVAHPGANASTGAPGTGGGASGGTSNYTGHAGGLTDTWDGGGAANIAGVYADNTTDGAAGSLPGQGGAGSWVSPQPGGGANITIIARA